jgi:crotonobetainyl-CoA:carnitine CoA-transferase CaiB-like acyl-CoA transferase
MELQNEPTFEQRGIMQVMQHAKHGPFKMPAWPVRVDGKPPRIKPSPILGEHTANVLTGWLGLTDADVETLRGEGVV